MLWFLRKFQYVNKLESDSASSKAVMALLQRRIDELSGQNLRLAGERDTFADEVFKLRGEHAHTLKLIANWQAVQGGSVRVPFPDVHVEPAPPPEPGPGSYEPVLPVRTPRDIQRDAVNESRRKAFELRQKINGQADTMGLGEV